MLSVVGLTVFVYTLALDGLALVADIWLIRSGRQTLTQYAQAGGGPPVVTLAVVVQLAGVSGLVVHLLN